MSKTPDIYDGDDDINTWLEEIRKEYESTPKRSTKHREVSPSDTTSGSAITTHPLHAVFPRNTKMGKAIAWWAAGVYTLNAGKKAYRWFNEKVEDARKEKFSISIESYDEEDLYNIVFAWIIENIEEDDTIYDYDLITIYRRPKTFVVRTSSTSNTFPMVLDGHEVQISLDESETKDGQVTSLKKHLVIRCKDQQSVDELSNTISELYESTMYTKVKDEVEAGRTPTPFAYWTGTHWAWKDMLPRNIDSVVLHNADKEMLLDDIEKFRSLKTEYLRTNIPWHRGYLFYGPPGTGKTSLGLAVASSYEVPIYVLGLNSVVDDSTLARAIGDIEVKEAVLILEDIDVVQATHNRELNKTPTSKGVSLAGLLNVLDGINSPSGLITIMTTNYLSTLDPALIRPGRVDIQLEIGYLDDDQLQRLVLWYIGKEVNNFPAIKSKITPAQITGIVKNFMGDPDQCVEEISKFIHESNQKS